MTEKLQSILEAEGLSALLGKFNEQGVTDSILSDLTDSDLKELGIDKLGERKRLLAAFSKSGCASAAAVSVVEESAPQGGSRAASSKTAATPAEATKHLPWVNTLGMPFVPIPRFETRFCIWPVRVQDYETYCMASGAKFPEIPFAQESDHPIVGVSWNDAIEFCVWLTGKERAEGKINDKTVYRLPTDLEWSAAVGLPHEPEATPAQRHLKAPGYPWGLRWPPPQSAGNYEHDRSDQWGLDHLKSEFLEFSHQQESYLAENLDLEQEVGRRLLEEDKQELKEKSQLLNSLYAEWRRGWRAVDEFEFTSAVTSFSPNEAGIYDLGGNVWEWCMESEASDRFAVLRGASYGIWRNAAKVHHKIERLMPFEVTLPMPNQDVYRSAFRAWGEKTAAPTVSMLIQGGFSNFPISGTRLVLQTV
ncbi:MAG: hypothetical protein FGM15_04810 [Chthoniobacterales bacterium]|nr:hypothetical protein [Chthoniobacterales bacterium]